MQSDASCCIPACLVENREVKFSRVGRPGENRLANKHRFGGSLPIIRRMVDQVHISKKSAIIEITLHGKRTPMHKQVVIITGASSGIGAAVARQLGKEGNCLTLAARRTDRLEAVAEEVRQSGGETIVQPADVTKLEDIRDMLKATLERWGRVDVLFNNAGASLDLPFADWEMEQIKEKVNINLLGVMACAHAVLPVMLKQKSGHIINTSSIAGLVATSNSIYSATKFGVVGFSDSLRRELLKTGVHVSAFCPGFTPSEISERLKAHFEGKTDASWIPGLMPSSYVGEQVAWLMRHPRRIYVIPKSWRFLVLLAYMAPGLADALINKF
jgi:short-subunit dehydrogenase